MLNEFLKHLDGTKNKMLDDTENISRKTWARNVEPVNKMGYMDGAADGQTAAFQPSFDMGYKQGLSFGLELGYHNAIKRLQQENNSKNDYITNIQDSRKINCQLCLNGIPSENVVNLYNTQQEKNNELTKRKQPT